MVPIVGPYLFDSPLVHVDANLFEGACYDAAPRLDVAGGFVARCRESPFVAYLLDGRGNDAVAQRAGLPPLFARHGRELGKDVRDKLTQLPRYRVVRQQ